jgi:hypothetical protein
MAKCGSCGAPRSSELGPCLLCGAARPTGRRPAEEDLVSLLRYDETIPTAKPITSDADPQLTVDIRPRLEFDAVARNTDPAVHVLVDIAPDGPPFLNAADGPVAHVILLLDVSASMNQPAKYPVLTEA